MKTYYESVFSHRFAGFKGIRRTQSPLWPDHRYIRDCSNLGSDEGAGVARKGSTVSSTAAGSIRGGGFDQELVLAVGTEVHLEQLS